MTRLLEDPRPTSRTSEIIAGWGASRPFNAADAFKLLEESRRTESALIDFALEEYLDGIRFGGPENVTEFVNRFPGHEQRLRPLVSQAAVLARPEASHWPQEGDFCRGFCFERLIGKGRFSRVYLAREAAVGSRVVVVKATTAAFSEVPILGNLRHPAIAEILSVTPDEESGLTFIAMPFQGTRTLSDWIALKNILTHGQPQTTSFGTLDPREYVRRSLRILLDIAEGLAFAHRHGVVHGDIKPQNILVADDGKAIVLDFNGARTAGEEGLGVYTLPFAAPELLEAVIDPTEPFRVTQATDLFGFAMMAVELLQRDAPASELAPLTAAQCLEYLASGQQQERLTLDLVPRAVRGELMEVLRRSLAGTEVQRRTTFEEMASSLRRAIARDESRDGRRRRYLRALLIAAVAAIPLSAVRPGTGVNRAGATERARIPDVSATVADLPSDETLPSNTPPIRLTARRWEDFNHLGLTSRKLGDWEQAARDFETALSLSPGNPAVIVNQLVLEIAHARADPTYVPSPAPAEAVLRIEEEIGFGPYLDSVLLCAMYARRTRTPVVSNGLCAAAVPLLLDRALSQGATQAEFLKRRSILPEEVPAFDAALFQAPVHGRGKAVAIDLDPLE